MTKPASQVLLPALHRRKPGGHATKPRRRARKSKKPAQVDPPRRPPKEFPQFPKRGITVEEMQAIDAKQREWLEYHCNANLDILESDGESECECEPERESEESDGEQMSNSSDVRSLEDMEIARVLAATFNAVLAHYPDLSPEAAHGPPALFTPETLLPSIPHNMSLSHLVKRSDDTLAGEPDVNMIGPSVNGESSSQTSSSGTAEGSNVIDPSENPSRLARLRPKAVLKLTEKANKVYRN
ncbi:hypothetical protein NMY22_g11907 [Coprinellus aureogranulatus]|nr:hypothetical protein NMY22_g11907 [Coprinellus aureogranulatus]